MAKIKTAKQVVFLLKSTYVVSGQAQIKVADEDRAVQAGSIVYVAKNADATQSFPFD